MTTNTNFEKVGEFHECFGHPKFDKPRYDIFDVDQKVVKFRQALIDEENGEFKEGCDKKDLVEVADALADMLYVIYGAGHVFGLNLDKLFTEVHDSNMSKLCSSEEEAIETVESYKKKRDEAKEGDQVYEDPVYKKMDGGKYWVVYDGKTSKILKSINFRNPNLKPIMDS